MDRKGRTSGGDTEVLAEDTPVSFPHFLQLLLRPMPLVDTRPESFPLLERICQHHAITSLPPGHDRASAVVHARDVSAPEADLGALPLAADSCRGVSAVGVILLVPVEHELAIVHLPYLTLLLVDTKIA